MENQRGLEARHESAVVEEPLGGHGADVVDVVGFVALELAQDDIDHIKRFYPEILQDKARDKMKDGSTVPLLVISVGKIG